MTKQSSANVRFDLEQELDAAFRRAAQKAFGEATDFDPTVRPSKHADWQVNGALAYAKRSGVPPRQIAEQLVEAARDERVVAKLEVAGPGFINTDVDNGYLTELITSLAADTRLGIDPVAEPQTVVVDYSSPNIAKNMHVGHLRTTIIGDALTRAGQALGHEMVRQNHLGDWGTQFGMLIEYLVDTGDPQRTAEGAVHDLDQLYRTARTKFDGDEDFATRARSRVVLLQQGDADTLALWDVLVLTSKRYFREVYDRLGVLLTEDDDRGESFYNYMLDETIADLESKGLVSESEGALCAYPPGFQGRDGEPFPFIVRKSDGGYGYAATDLATLRHSVATFDADRLVYVTDTRQSQHFHMVFAVARQAGWIDDGVQTEHVGYGMVMGADGKPFKTRSGEVVKLVDLLDEAVERAERAMTERTSDLDEAERRSVAAAVGIGAVKWFDLKNEHTNNYVFDFDRMLAFSGNTGPYVQYASTRAKSVLRKAHLDTSFHAPVILREKAERQLALHLPGLGPAVAQVFDTDEPHHLCTYLYELAERYTTFYENCHVLNAPDDSVKQSRLTLCALTARTLDAGLQYLGIATVERM